MDLDFTTLLTDLESVSKQARRNFVRFSKYIQIRKASELRFASFTGLAHGLQKSNEVTVVSKQAYGGRTTTASLDSIGAGGPVADTAAWRAGLPRVGKASTFARNSGCENTGLTRTTVTRGTTPAYQCTHRDTG